MLSINFYEWHQINILWMKETLPVSSVKMYVSIISHDLREKILFVKIFWQTFPFSALIAFYRAFCFSNKQIAATQHTTKLHIIWSTQNTLMLVKDSGLLSEITTFIIIILWCYVMWLTLGKNNSAWECWVGINVYMVQLEKSYNNIQDT